MVPQVSNNGQNASMERPHVGQLQENNANAQSSLPMTTPTQIVHFDGQGFQNSGSGSVIVGRDLNIGARPEDGQAKREEEKRARRKEFLDRLCASPYEDGKNTNPRRAEGTCQWVTNHPCFEKWLGNCYDLLLVSADPGCGKSVLARYLVDDIVPSNTDRKPCYFFFKDGEVARNDVKVAIRCLLHQIFTQQGDLLTDELFDSFVEAEQRFWTRFSEPWAMLLEAARRSKHEIICVLDALDECINPEELTSTLADLFGNTSNSKRTYNLKFIITARPYLAIQDFFQKLECSRCGIIRGEDQEEAAKVEREIDVVLEQKIKGICTRLQLNETEKKILQEGLSRFRHRTYLWLDLVFPEIEKAVSLNRKDLKKSVRSLPSTVDMAYENILKKSSDCEQAMKILHLVVAAKRPLSVDELREILALQDHSWHRNVKNDQLSRESFKISAREACGLFITIQDSRVFFFHQTAREFLIRSSSREPEKNTVSPPWWHTFLPGESHRILADVCIRYLRLREFHDMPIVEFEFAGFEKTRQSHSGRIKDESDLFFLDYATLHWTEHYNQADRTKGSELERLAISLCLPNGGFCSTWLDTYGRKRKESLRDVTEQLDTPLLIASFFGLCGVAHYALSHLKADRRERSHGNGRTALAWASRMGHKPMVELLLNRVPRHQKFWESWQWKPRLENMVDRSGNTPLIEAASNGHLDIVKFLVDRGVDMNVKDKFGTSPLDAAAKNGHLDVLEYLIYEDVGLSASHDTSKERLLLEAAKNGRRDVVEFFANKGTNLNTRQDRYGYITTPLLNAVASGSPDVVEYLVSQGADMDVRGMFDLTPLLLAATFGQDDIVSLLLAKSHIKNDGRDGPIGDSDHQRNAFLALSRIREALREKGIIEKSLGYCVKTVWHAFSLLGLAEPSPPQPVVKSPSKGRSVELNISVVETKIIF